MMCDNPIYDYDLNNINFSIILEFLILPTKHCYQIIKFIIINDHWGVPK